MVECVPLINFYEDIKKKMKTTTLNKVLEATEYGTNPTYPDWWDDFAAKPVSLVAVCDLISFDAALWCWGTASDNSFEADQERRRFAVWCIKKCTGPEQHLLNGKTYEALKIADTFSRSALVSGNDTSGIEDLFAAGNVAHQEWTDLSNVEVVERRETPNGKVHERTFKALAGDDELTPLQIAQRDAAEAVWQACEGTVDVGRVAWCAANAAAWWVVGNTVSLKPKKEVWQEAFDEARFHQRVKFIDMMQEG